MWVEVGGRDWKEKMEGGRRKYDQAGKDYLNNYKRKI